MRVGARVGIWIGIGVSTWNMPPAFFAKSPASHRPQRRMHLEALETLHEAGFTLPECVFSRALIAELMASRQSVAAQLPDEAYICVRSDWTLLKDTCPEAAKVPLMMGCSAWKTPFTLNEGLHRHRGKLSEAILNQRAASSRSRWGDIAR